MFISTAVVRAARASPIKQPHAALKTAPNILRFLFDPNPGPLNCCTQLTTRIFLHDECHPYHIKTKRRIAAFDSNRFHWSVTAHVDIAKKKTVRSWVKRRIETAVREELRARGWAPDGRVLDHASPNSGSAKSSLKGALKITIATDQSKAVITATGDEVRQSVNTVLRRVFQRQTEPKHARRDGVQKQAAGSVRRVAGPRDLDSSAHKGGKGC